MELRTDDADAPRKRAGRFLVWAAVAAVLVAGIVIALIHGPRLTPLLDTLP
ncbi:MAG TPA: hypothetical protein VLE53_04970 [Gemmatimonadaceae bacterium]|nr:hypothetical protein [Gemmatimonadaceae bacterium]